MLVDGAAVHQRRQLGVGAFDAHQQPRVALVVSETVPTTRVKSRKNLPTRSKSWLATKQGHTHTHTLRGRLG